MANGKTSEYLKYEFTRAELAEKSQELARHTQLRDQLEQQKREIDKQLAAQIEAAISQVKVLAQHVSTGYEMRMVDCILHFHAPKEGRCTIERADNGELIRERAMTSEEMQESLQFGEATAQ